MANEIQKPKFLITLTAPSCAGKSYLLDYIRNVAKLPCLVSTTTRARRAGEVEGVDYYFITEEESKAIEAQNGFAELAHYRGVRYGVTNQEYFAKLDQGVAFLIVEPTGIDHYTQPAKDAGATHLKYFIHTDMDIRLERLRKRMRGDIQQVIIEDALQQTMATMAGLTAALPLLSDKIATAMNPHLDRMSAMLTSEQRWYEMAVWTRVLFGKDDPVKNLEIILNDVKTESLIHH